MKKRRSLLVVLLGLLLLPFLTSAQSTQTSCPNLSRNLSIGMGGNDVIALQNFLIAQNLLPQGDNTGYFGRLTKAAAIEFQGQQNLPTTGFVGPLTRAALAQLCGEGQIVNQTTDQTTTINPNGIGNFSASPMSGTAPLSVTFNFSNIDLKDTYSFDFGDNGLYGNPTFVDCTTSSLCTAGSISHTYTSPGVYVTHFDKRNADYCNNKSPCDPPGSTEVSSIKITVSGTPSSSATIDPSSLVMPPSSGIFLSGTETNVSSMLVVVISATYTGATDYYSLYTQACGRVTSACNSAAISNGHWVSGGNSGIMVGPGTYHVYVFDASTHLLLASAVFTTAQSAAATTAAQASSPMTLSASPMSGPAPLQVTFTTNNVSPSDAGTIYFGDGAAEDDPACPPTSGNPCNTTVNIHRYTVPGVFAVKLYEDNIADGSPQSIIASLVVTVTSQ